MVKTPLKPLSVDRGTVLGIVVLAFAWMFVKVGLFLGALVALTWGTHDLVASGPNFWAIAWIVLGSIVVLFSLVEHARKR